MYANLQTLSNKSGIAVNDIVLELLRYPVLILSLLPFKMLFFYSE